MSKKQNSDHKHNNASSDLDALSKKLNDAKDEPLSETLANLLSKAQRHEKWPVAQLISVFERNTDECQLSRHQLISHIEANPAEFDKQAMIFGFTGTPGAGKSSLIGELCLKLLKTDPDISIAVLAIDPSSHESGGALLGDRTRTLFPVDDNRLYFRSQASQQDLGGMSKITFHVTRILRKLFDVIIIETVGIGQSEIEVQRLSDHTCLIMQPLAGDQVQFMKAGIMEVPDTFIINKCDEDALARKSLHLLKSSLKLARIYVDNEASVSKAIFLTSATKHRGIDELSEFIFNLVRQKDRSNRHEQESYFLKKWIRQAYGEFGIGVYEGHFDKAELTTSTFEEKELRFKQLIARFLVNEKQT